MCNFVYIDEKQKKELTMQKFNTLGLIFDTAQLEKTLKLITSLYDKIGKYNGQVEKANKLLREHEQLRNKLNIKVTQGKVEGLTK